VQASDFGEWDSVAVPVSGCAFVALLEVIL
jgi:hypothetical protein